MPTSRQVIAGVAALGALGLALGGYMEAPWRDATAGAPGGKPAVGTKLGYLSPKELPDSVSLLPPPPTFGSPAMHRDEQARAAALPLRGTPRYALAAADADRDQAKTVAAFQCAFGTGISAERTPRLNALLGRVRLDVRAASYPAKTRYKRPRPFIVHQARTCYPADEAMVRDDGSYPSARGAVGWAYALVLAELDPARAATILQRGRDFGESRVVCDQEWQSDVDAGQTIAAATVGRLEAKAAFQADLQAARTEVNAELARGITSAKDCRPEREALASR